MNKKLFITLTVGGVLSLLQAQSVSDLSNEYHRSENSIERKNAIYQLSNQIATPDLKVSSRNSSRTDEAEDLLRQALNDKNYMVVEEAIVQIGKLGMDQFDAELSDLFTDVNSRFQGYSERIKLAIFQTAGSINGPFLNKVLKDELSKDNGSVQSIVLLEALKKTGDASTVDDLNAYIAKLYNVITRAKQKGSNPLLYSEIQYSLNYAQGVREFLASNKDGE